MPWACVGHAQCPRTFGHPAARRAHEKDCPIARSLFLPTWVDDRSQWGRMDNVIAFTECAARGSVRVARNRTVEYRKPTQNGESEVRYIELASDDMACGLDGTRCSPCGDSGEILMVSHKAIAVVATSGDQCNAKIECDAAATLES